MPAAVARARVCQRLMAIRQEQAERAGEEGQGSAKTGGDPADDTLIPLRLHPPRDCRVAAVVLYWHRWSDREAERQTNNAAKLSECDPELTAKVRAVLRGLETEGYQPWIRESWRSPIEQEHAYLTGRSEIRLGFHNVTGRNGEHRAFAVDVVERMDGARAKPRYAVTLARLASASDLQNGYLMGLMEWEQRALKRAVQTQVSRLANI